MRVKRKEVKPSLYKLIWVLYDPDQSDERAKKAELVLGRGLSKRKYAQQIKTFQSVSNY